MRGPTSPASSPWRPARRALLTGAFGSGALALTGCRIRLEDSAPEIPFIPTRDPIPAEPALLWLLGDCRQLAQDSRDAVESGEDDAAANEQVLYEEQFAVLRTALYRAGIPIETLDEVVADPLPSPTSASVSASASPDHGAGAALRRLSELAQCGGGLFPLVMSLLAQRWATLASSGAQIPEESVQQDPALLWNLPYLAVPFAQLTDAAHYGFEVVAAQSRDEIREVALEGLYRIQGLWRAQDTRSGGRAPASEFGYLLPFPVSSEESARRLATHVSAGLIDGYAGLLPSMVGSAQEQAATDLVTWLGTAAAVGISWGVPLGAFPGTAAPSTP